ncbi:uncharacterized protein [Mycetomoellerius zeteki]|uniref:uncharacterized protein n=1 Tax=Mycetomoellerius zeteki TaxID=64791 RepID=UPI00084EC5C0|nr:PREDICTED: uncharacterized protein LOC108729599 [Trachymyrmex zeteki]
MPVFFFLLDAFRALIVLSLLLPPLNYSRKRVQSKKNNGRKKLQSKKSTHITTSAEVPNPDLIKILPEGTNLPYTKKNIRAEAKGNIQPCIMRIQGQHFLCPGRRVVF